MDDDTKIQEFRKVLKAIKKSTLNKYTSDTQDISAVDKVVKKLEQLHRLLRPVAQGTMTFDQIPIKEIKDLFYTTLSPEMSKHYKILLEYYLERDLIDYPLTLDEEVIDTYDKDEKYIHPKIIPNIE